MSINSVVISGNITRDMEVRAAGNTPLGSFSLAVNERVKQDGEWTDRANFIDCLLWGSRAESMASMLTKGTKVAVAGRLRWSSWEKDGQKRSKVEVVIDTIELMSKGDKSDAPYSPPATAYENLENEIPF